MKNILSNMKKLSKIDESAWGDMMRRGSGENIRTEDQLQSIDLGNHCNVYFADKDFTVGDKSEFTLDEKKSLTFPSGWRLPTISDFEDTIYQDINEYNDKPHKNIKIIDNLPEYIIIKNKKFNEELYFEMNGKMRVIYWCCDNDTAGVEFGYCPRSTGDYVVYGGYYPNAKGRIRLVKDK